MSKERREKEKKKKKLKGATAAVDEAITQMEIEREREMPWTGGPGWCA
jgi:hypothetical protein